MVKITRNIVKKIARNILEINVVKNTRITVKRILQEIWWKMR